MVRPVTAAARKKQALMSIWSSLSIRGRLGHLLATQTIRNGTTAKVGSAAFMLHVRPHEVERNKFRSTGPMEENGINSVLRFLLVPILVHQVNCAVVCELLIAIGVHGDVDTYRTGGQHVSRDDGGRCSSVGLE